MIVDCSNRRKSAEELENANIDANYAVNYGCDGGWSWRTFDFMRRHGNMLEQDYPYAAEDQVCQYDRKKKVKNVRNYKHIPGDEAIMRKSLNRAPMYISIAWGTDLFSYSSGIIDPTDASANYCAASTNHGVVLVGYVPGDEDSQEVTTKEVPICRMLREEDESGCRHEGEINWHNRYCCKYETKEVHNSDAHWILQNSHGTSWGEQGKFRVKLSNDFTGFCQMNTKPVMPLARTQQE